MSARYTRKEAAKFRIVENKVKLRPTKKEAIEKAELEEIKNRAVRAKCACTHSDDFKTIRIKPMSQNEAWQGRRFKSKIYKKYEVLVMGMLPKITVPAGKLRIDFEFGFSNPASDIDNPLKSVTDILQKKYGFNDKNIYEMNLKKVIVKKGEEYFTFRISAF